ncbi:hypothetical protein GCM10008906_15270 [Clostridium oceanicum]|uniref:Uncharacterized protein n=1 Tax=Clostridium oceanicum TaxID=1543 RepID=A0ABN1JF12_9CLOT
MDEIPFVFKLILRKYMLNFKLFIKIKDKLGGIAKKNISSHIRDEMFFFIVRGILSYQILFKKYKIG